MNIVGKTIARVVPMKRGNYDDEAWIKLEFTDGTSALITGGYESWDDKKFCESEYCCMVSIVEFYDDGELNEIKN